MTQRALVPLVIDMESKQKIIAVVAVLIVVVAAVAAVMMTKDKDDGGSADPADTYYFYFDGFDEKSNGWQSVKSDDIAKAFDSAVKSADLDLVMSESGWVSSERYPDSYDSVTSAGIGLGIFGYISTSNVQPSERYFVDGPVLTNLNSNILYISYGKYTMDEKYVVSHEVGPASNDSWKTTGPFAVGADYEPLSFGDKYYFYLDGMGDSNGWYSATAKDGNIAEAFLTAIKDTGLTATISDTGWLQIEGYADKYDPVTNTGSGLALYAYTSKDTAQPYAGYFFDGPVITEITGYILYISYTDFVFDESYNATYTLNPATSDGWMTSGPFAVA